MLGPPWQSDYVEEEYLSCLALNMNYSIYEARELIPVNDLMVVLEGMVAIRYTRVPPSLPYPSNLLSHPKTSHFL